MLTVSIRGTKSCKNSTFCVTEKCFCISISAQFVKTMVWKLPPFLSITTIVLLTLLWFNLQSINKRTMHIFEYTLQHGGYMQYYVTHSIFSCIFSMGWNFGKHYVVVHQSAIKASKSLKWFICLADSFVILKKELKC